MMFRVGQQVECIDDSPSEITGYKDLHLGAVYVIAGFDPETRTGIYLEGVPLHAELAKRAGWLFPYAWNPKRFRPIVERKTDISIFTAMLTPSKQGVSA